MEEQKLPTGGRIVVEKADGKPQLRIEWTYEETPPTVERQRDNKTNSSEENGIGSVPTCKLVEELSGRLGVERHEAYPEEPFDLHTEGPAIVLIITD